MLHYCATELLTAFISHKYAKTILAAIILALVIGGQDNVNVKVIGYFSRQGAVIAIAIAIVPPRVKVIH
jgi:hypothetical protein